MEVDNSCPGCRHTYPAGFHYNSGFTVRCPNQWCKFRDDELYQKYTKYCEEKSEEFTADDFEDLFNSKGFR